MLAMFRKWLTRYAVPIHKVDAHMDYCNWFLLPLSFSRTTLLIIISMLSMSKWNSHSLFVFVFAFARYTKASGGVELN